MKLFSVFLFFIALQSCTAQRIEKKEKGSLYINTSIPAHNSLAISTEDASLFSIVAKKTSIGRLKILNESEEIEMEKNKTYTLNVNQKGNIVFLNQSDQGTNIQLRVYNHTSKIIQKKNLIH
ncbi:hypothetical protein [Sphingobacterium multivorum]|uniref:hypothetical protein n=1 Tax=Sphingobacterium siyangense TaxID=459529 RepID=UPI001918EC82|nr:hypothetical protein [Sphingobacterium multivorum]QQT31837.1 hypothetical protein I6I99_04535 [Sphingobacterium multivorum]